MRQFQRAVGAKYRVVAAKGEIKTSEPIKITWEVKDGIMVIKVDDIDYAVIEDVDDVSEIDLDKVEYWVRETYYDDDYKSDQYVAPRLKKQEFANAADLDEFKE